MKNNPTVEGARWLAQALCDVDDARYLSAGERHSLACFVAQQAAEKALKAFLYATGREFVWGHSVAELCHEAGQLDSRFLEKHPMAASLDKYYIPTRYPNGLPGGIPSEAFGEHDSSHAISTATRIIELVTTLLKPGD